MYAIYLYLCVPTQERVLRCIKIITLLYYYYIFLLITTCAADSRVYLKHNI
jgi:hypothetical protein